MNTTFPIWQNRTHPAWLALPLLAILIVGLQLCGATNYELIHLLNPIALASLGIWIFWSGSANGSPEARHRLKEFRILLWPTLLAIIPPTLYSAAKLYEAGGELRDMMIGLHWVGIIALSAMVFGREFEHKTMGGLLTAPGSRSRIYRSKLTTMAILMVVSVFSAASSYELPLDSELLWEMIAGSLILFCTAPTLALKTRSTLAAAVFSVSIPAALILAGTLLLILLAKWKGLELETDSFVERRLIYYSWMVLPTYGIGMAIWGWHTFKNLQLVDGGNVTDSVHPLAKPMDDCLRKLTGGVRSPAAALFRKELRLHGVPWLVAWIYVGLWLILAITQHYYASQTILNLKLGEIHPLAAGTAGALVILLCGAGCIAEERQLGTLDWQLTFPATLARQWRVKLATTFFLALALGIVLPLALCWLGVEESLQDLLPHNPTQQIVLAAFGMGLFTMAVYGSSLARSTVAAAAIAISSICGLIILCIPVINGWNRWSMTQQAEATNLWNAGQLSAPPMIITTNEAILVTSSISAAGVLGLLLFANRFSRKNFAGGIPSREAIVKQYAILAGILWLTIGTLTGIATIADVWSQRSDLVTQLQIPGMKQGKVGPAIRRTNIDPELAKRYGLTQMGAADMAATNLNQSTQSNGLNPELARRYGLIPATNPPAFKEAP